MTDLPTTTTDDDATLIAHPVTGEAIDFETASADSLDQTLRSLDDHEAKVKAFRAAVKRELIARVDRTLTREAWIGGTKYRVNAPEGEFWEEEMLIAGLEALITEEKIDESVLDTVAPLPAPKPAPAPVRRVDKRKLTPLKRSGDLEVKALLARVRTVGPQPRTITVVQRAADAKALPAGTPPSPVHPGRLNESPSE